MATRPSIQSYFGIPYVDRFEADRTGCNCNGLVMLFYREQFGIDLPAHRNNNTSEVEQQIAEEIAKSWIEINVPKFGDVVRHRESGREHIGIVVDQSDLFLHTREGKDVSIEHYNAPFWRSCLVGFYRHKDRF